MAIALTNTYTKVAEKEMGFWYGESGNKCGTLYLRVYSRFNQSNNIEIQARVYNNGGYCWSGNCYATVQGVNVVNNVRLDFTARAEITLGTRTVSAGVVNAIATFRCYGLGLSNTYKAQCEVTLPSDKATGLDFDIGSATIITITRYNSNFTRTLEASIGSFKQILMEKGTDTQITWQPDASSLYAQVPDSNSGIITLTITTYDGDNVIGTSANTLTCRVTNSNPVINAVTITDNNNVISKDVIVRYRSVPKLEINAQAANYATIVKYSVTELNSSTVNSDSNTIILPNTVTNNSFEVSVTDSRGNTTSKTVTAGKFIEYNLPAIPKVKLTRTGEALDSVQAEISGVWYNGSLSIKDNAMLLKYRYKQINGEYSSYKTIISENQASQFWLTVDLEEKFLSNTIYIIEFALADSITVGVLEVPLSKAIPLTDHWNDGEEDYYNINARLQTHGVDVMLKSIQYNADLNDINDTCFNYCNMDCTNRPITENGYLFTHRLSDNYSYQRYTVFWGKGTYERFKVDGQWWPWNKISEGIVLYDNEAGATGTITLSESAANFSYIEIYHELGYTKVKYPNGKTVSLSGIRHSDQLYQMYDRLVFSGTTVTRKYDGKYDYNGEYYNGTHHDKDYLLYKIVGHK